MEAMGVSIKSGCSVGRAGSSLATGTGGTKWLNMGVWARVVADIGACSPVVGAARGALGVLRLAVGAWVLVARCACSMAVLFPSFWTVIPRGRWVRLLSGSLTLCGWGSIPLLSAGVHAPVCWGFPAFALAGGALASLFSLSGPCSRGCRAAWADAPSGGVRVSPVYLRSGRCRCCRVRVGNARSPVGGGVVSVRGGVGA